ncbi:MAG: DUF1501 domain-containing protein [Rubricoccaceae bacterium]|nr:DUF1501 domain-containing protein [Rubricoccaceae bacterium]
MCQHPHPPRSDRAISLAHGADHDRDHAAWSRRTFLSRSALAAGGTAFLLNGVPVHASSGSSLLHLLSRFGADRVLVLIQMAGGNDGLNMVVPVTNDLYYQRRPTIAVPQSNTFRLDDDYGLHGAMGAAEPMWGDGHLAVVQTVGYPDHNLSHFRSTDIWASASDADETLSSGWTGRYLDHAYPDYVTSPPEYPVAVRIGGASALLVRGGATSMGMSFSNADQLLQLATTGQFYDEDDVPPGVYGEELSFIRSIYNASLRYRDVVVEAANAATNAAEYPTDGLGSSLALIARLIKGGLPSRLYVVEHGGFDTHSNQTDRQPDLLQRLAESLAAFDVDLADGGRSDTVMSMTFSEFGRRVEENGSGGTDHGTAAPLVLAGGGVNGGLYGDGPDLADLDGSGNLHHSVDFRQIYATLLRQWFGVPQAETDALLGGAFDPLGFIGNPVAAEPGAAPHAAVLEAPYPNPFRGRTTVAFALDRPGRVALTVSDARGRLVARLASGPHTAGRHAVPFHADGLPSGVYHLRLETDKGVQSRPVTVVR